MTTIDKLRIIQLKANTQNIIEFNEIKIPEPTTAIGHMWRLAIFQWNVTTHRSECYSKFNHLPHSTLCCCGGIRHFHIHTHKIALINVLCQNDCILWRIIKKKWKSFSTKNAMQECMSTLTHRFGWMSKTFLLNHSNFRFSIRLFICHLKTILTVNNIGHEFINNNMSWIQWSRDWLFKIVLCIQSCECNVYVCSKW